MAVVENVSEKPLDFSIALSSLSVSISFAITSLSVGSGPFALTRFDPDASDEDEADSMELPFTFCVREDRGDEPP